MRGECGARLRSAPSVADTSPNRALERSPSEDTLGLPSPRLRNRDVSPQRRGHSDRQDNPELGPAGIRCHISTSGVQDNKLHQGLGA